LLIWFLGPLGILVLARHLGAPVWGGLVGALGFAASGFYTGNAEHTSSLYSICLLPFVIWRLDTALLSRRLGPATGAGALWGLSGLGGYPQLTILSGAYVFLWAVGRWWSAAARRPESSVGATGDMRSAQSSPRLLFAISAVAAVAVVGILVLSPTYLGYFTEAFGYSDRVGPRPRYIALGQQPLAAGALTTFSSPYLPLLKIFGNPTLWPITDVSMSSVYLGALVFVLALFALVARSESRWRWWLALVSVFFVLAALGDQFPLRGWLYDFFYPTRYFRNPALFRVYAMFSVVVLALLATKDIQTATADAKEDVWQRLLCVAGVGAIGATAAYIFVLARVQNRGPRLAAGSILLVLVWGGAVAVAAMSTRLRWRAWVPSMLVTLAIVDALGTILLCRPTLYTTETRPRWDRINAERRSELSVDQGLTRVTRPPEWLGPQLNNRNIALRIATLDNYMTMTNRFQIQFARNPLLAAMSTGADRMWFAPAAAVVTPNDAADAAFRRRSLDLNAPVVVLHSRKEISRIYQPGETGPTEGADREAIRTLPAATRLASRVIRYEPNALHFEVISPASGWLLVTDRWAPGWRVKVNGERQEVLGGNFVFRAIPVRTGANEVEFSYQPACWLFTLLLSWGTLAIVLACSVARQWRAGRAVPHPFLKRDPA
jgi:hypothetical protein